MQREDDVEAVEAYAKANEKEFQNVCEDTFDAIAILTNHKSIMDIKEQSQKEGGKYDMCEAFRQMEERGENRLSQLIAALIQDNMINEIKLVASDKIARDRYYAQYGIK